MTSDSQFNPSRWVISLLLIFSMVGHLTGQESSADMFAKGPLRSRQEAMRQLVKLKLDGKSLTLNRHWGQSESVTQKEDRMDLEAERLIKRGIDPRIADNIVRRQNRKSSSLTKVQKAFFQLKGVIGSLSSSQSGNQIRLSLKNNELVAILAVDDKNFSLRVEEKQSPHREFRLDDNGLGRLEFYFSGKDFVVRLAQQPSGKIELFHDDVIFEAANYEDLKNQHPKQIKNLLIPIFEHLGFELPIMSDDRFVQDSVLSQLMSIKSRSLKEFENYIRELDDDSFQVRENATKMLKSQMELWQDAMRNKLNNEPLSLEAKVRLERVMSESIVNGSIDELIQAQDLLNSPSYLVTLFKIANEEESSAIVTQLESLTGRSESSPEAWVESITK